MRVSEAAGFILHSRPFRETSSIVEVFSREYGRIGLVARGARAGKSRWRGLLQPFRQLEFSWIKRGQLGTLTGLDMDIGWPELSGTRLYCGLYLNELMIRLVRQEDPDAVLYQAYGRALHELSAQTDQRLALRRFEKQLLQSLGFALNLEAKQHAAENTVANAGPQSEERVQAKECYTYEPLSGPVHCLSKNEPRGQVYTGEMLLALANDDFSQPHHLPAMRRLLQSALRVQLGGRELASQKMLRKLL